ncbi:MAG: RimK family alpha-L-glutamate ligase [Flavobacteriales bacterium]
MIGILYEHPHWHQPLFDALEKRAVAFEKINLADATFDCNAAPQASFYYNLVSPSAYKRGNQRAVPLAFALCRHLEMQGARVLNGSSSMLIEMSKSAQIALLKNLNIDYPATVVFNSLDALIQIKDKIAFPCILKPEQGGSGARMYLANNWNELQEILESDKDIWWPDNLLLVQEKLDYDREQGIVRLEFLGERFLYAMRVVTHDSFNLCPSLVCNPLDGDGTCEMPKPNNKKPEFYPYPRAKPEVIENARRIMQAAGHSSGSVEYCVTADGRTVIYDINANSNLRESVAAHFGINAFDAIIDFLLIEMEKQSN